MIRIKNVLCPVDFSPVSRRALDYAIAFSKNYGARLQLLHVIAPVVPGFYVDVTNIEATVRKHVDREMPKLLKLARDSGVQPETVVSTGDIAKEIQMTAGKTRADVVIVGKH